MLGISELGAYIWVDFAYQLCSSRAVPRGARRMEVVPKQPQPLLTEQCCSGTKGNGRARAVGDGGGLEAEEVGMLASAEFRERQRARDT